MGVQSRTHFAVSVPSSLHGARRQSECGAAAGGILTKQDGI